MMVFLYQLNFMQCYSGTGNAMVDKIAFSACRESSRVCCTMMGTSDRMMLAYSVSRGTGSGSVRSLKRTCFVRWSGTVNLYGPTGGLSVKYSMISIWATLPDTFKMQAVS